MKRRNNFYKAIGQPENLRNAARIAARGKRKQYGVKRFERNPEPQLDALQRSLELRTYRTAAYKTFYVYEPKERLVYSLPFCPDRVAQTSCILETERTFMSVFTADCYSCVKDKGIHGAVRAVKRALRDEPGTRYCLKLDVQKFYPSVDHRILKGQLRRIFKDEALLNFFYDIIDSADGVPIGNYTSQFFANLYLTGFDHWLKEVKRVKYYFRYADDLVFFSDDKAYLHQLLSDIREYLKTNLNLTLKSNYQVFPVDARGVDFLGYVFFHGYTLMRKRIKQNFARLMARKYVDYEKFASYWSWAKHADTVHLMKTLTSCRTKQAA